MTPSCLRASVPSCLPGGFVLIGLRELAAAWSAHRNGDIGWADFKAWLAAWEIRQRRYAGKAKAIEETPLPAIELAALADLKAPQKAVRSLERAGLITGGQMAFRFASGASEAAEAFLRRLPPRRSHLLMPRRLLRWLIGQARSIVAAAMACLIRCVWREGLETHVVGSLTARWVARTFGLGERAVRSALARLAEAGWLRRVERPGWHVARCGATWRVNLAWPDAEAESAPPEGANPLQNAGGLLLSRTRPPSGFKDTDTQGVSRRAMPLDLEQLADGDLDDATVVMWLYARAIQRGFVSDCEADRLNWMAAAVHALRVGDRPAALFTALVRGRRWEWISDGDEEAARQRLLDYDGMERPASRLAEVT